MPPSKGGSITGPALPLRPPIVILFSKLLRFKRLNQMTEETEPQDNPARLLSHLEEGSLAARLVEVYHSPQDMTSEEAIKAVLDERLEKVKADLARTET